MIPSEWFDAVITFATDPNNSAEVNLRASYEYLTVLIPTLSNASITTVHISNTSGGTFYPVYQFDADATADFAHATTDADTSKAATFRIGGAQYIKVVTDDNQTANTTFKVRGFNRG